MPEANIVFDLNPVSQVTAGVVGKPGKRTFYLQGRQGRTVVTLRRGKGTDVGVVDRHRPIARTARMVRTAGPGYRRGDGIGGAD